MDDTLLNVRRDGLLRYSQFRKRGATSRDTDVCPKRFNVYRKIERQGEDHGRVIGAGSWIVCGASREEQLEFVELNRLDYVEPPSIRKDSLNDEALDSVV